MEWNWRFWQGMRIWSKCTKAFKKRKHEYISPFLSQTPWKVKYSCSQIYLGITGKVVLLDCEIELSITISEYDGILVQIKRVSPYCILFEYVDGAYYINDESDRDYHKLVAILLDLSCKINQEHLSTIYETLESSLYTFMLDGF